MILIMFLVILELERHIIMKDRVEILIFVLVVVMLVTSSCKHDSPFEDIEPQTIIDPTVTKECDIDTIYFENTIKPLINNSCATTDCHDAITAQDGIILDTYANIIISGEVKPHKPNDSKLYEVLLESGDDLMPPDNPLSSEQIALIKKWIEQGAKNNECIEDCVTESMSYLNNIWPTLRDNCNSCHSGGSPSGGIKIENYNDVKILVNNSKLLNVLYGRNGAPLMPTTGQLQICKIQQIEQWINDGALNN